MSGLIPYIAAAGAAILAIFMAFIKGQSAGANKERNKQLQERQAARDISDQVDNDLGALPPTAKREELGTWSPKR
jgi:hypothetical protein